MGVNQRPPQHVLPFAGIPTTAPLVTNMWTILSARPYSMASTTGSMAKDVWRFVPCWTPTPIPIKALTLETTVAASGGTAAAIFALFTVGSDGRPASLMTDLSSAGTVDLTAAAGILQRTLTTTIPAGECFIGSAWTGTATTAPTVRVLAGTHPRIIDAAAGVVTRCGYLASVSGATAPATVTVNTTATTGVAHFGQIQ